MINALQYISNVQHALEAAQELRVFFVRERFKNRDAFISLDDPALSLILNDLNNALAAVRVADQQLAPEAGNGKD